MLQEAIDLYHNLLTDELAADVQEAFNRDLRKRHLYFGERPLCTVLRPHFYEAEQWVYLKQETEILLGAFAKAHAACMIDAELRRQLDLEAYEEALFNLDIGYDAPWTTSRLASFYEPDTRELRFVEYNAETPAGMAYDDNLAQAFFEVDSVHRFLQHYP